MERVLKKENGKPVDSGRDASHSNQGNLASRLGSSPAMIAQRKKLQGLFGGAIQMQAAEGEILQGQFLEARRAEAAGSATGTVAQRVITNPNYNAPAGASVDIQAPLATGQSPTTYKPPGWCLDADPVNNPNNYGQTKPHHHERGHLIGQQFGGIGGASNLVTMTAKTNGYDMLAQENTIVGIINANPGIQYTYTVTPVYSTGFAYSHLGNVDPGLANHVYCRHPAPEFIDMDLSVTGGGSVHNVRVDNAEMYAQHLY